MASVVFMRGVNVGGHKAFRPAALAKELAAFDVVNVGAAGTFVIRKPVAQATLRAELLQRLPFQADVMICRGRDLLELARGKPFSAQQSGEDTQRFVVVMAKRPPRLPRLPITHPAGDQWQVKILAVSGAFALTLWRRTGERQVYPSEIVEKNFGVSATTRNWNTIMRLCNILEGG